MSTCIQHGVWGENCGPDCRQMTAQWNAAEPEKRTKRAQWLEVGDTLTDGFVVKRLLRTGKKATTITAYGWVSTDVPRHFAPNEEVEVQ